MWLLAPLLACSSPSDTGAAPAEAIQSALPSGVASNLLMISADTLRRDHAGRYGGGDLTPWLDGFLAGGLALDDHRSCSNWTYPATLCALSGQTGSDMGWIPEGFGRYENHIPELEVLPERLGAAGFETSLVTSNAYLGSFSGLDATYGTVWENMTGAQWITQRALEAYAPLVGAERWFLHVHFLDPHASYSPPEGYVEGLEGLEPLDVDLDRAYTYDELNAAWPDLSEAYRALVSSHLRARYAGEVRYLDDQLALLFEALESASALDDTLVVFWSDHGEQLGERGSLTHGQSLYRGEVDAIAGLSAPGLPPAAWSQPTTHADLLPTLLHLLGLAPSPDATGAIVDAAPADRPTFAVHLKDAAAQSVVQGDLELIFDWSDASRALYDRSADPDQQDDLAASRPEDVERLWALLSPRVEALDAILDDR